LYDIGQETEQVYSYNHGARTGQHLKNVITNIRMYDKCIYETKDNTLKKITKVSIYNSPTMLYCIVMFEAAQRFGARGLVWFVGVYRHFQHK